MGFPLCHIRSQIMSWSSDSQVCSAWGQPIGRVEQNHGDISSDGISCGGRAMLPNCQADFTVMGREGRKERGRGGGRGGGGGGGEGRGGGKGGGEGREEEKKGQTKTGLAQSPISKQHR